MENEEMKKKHENPQKSNQQYENLLQKEHFREY